MDKAKQQMEFLFEEGGMADDGLDRDPVSGNEVPSGSMSEEVRDDIPAQLSEGEYVVPADVVRYYGVRYFEDLRQDAKMGLNEMEQDGRIGGEPVDMEGDDTQLTTEEMAELESIMGMAVGGFVTEQPTQATDPYKAQTELYRSPAPVAIGNTMEPRAFQVGGDVPASTQVMPDFSKFRAGYSFMGPQAGQAGQTGIPSIKPSSNVTLYGPNGEVINLILPAQQAQYDDLISKGYSTQPVAKVQEPTVSFAAQDSGPDYTNAQRDLRATLDEQSGFRGFTTDELGNVESDPIGYANTMLSEEAAIPRGAAIGAGALLGPVGAAVGLAGMGSQLDNIARARAARNIAEAQGKDVTELDRSIAAALEDMPRGVRMLESLGFGSGRRYTEAMTQGIANPVTIGPKKQAANSLLRNLTGPAAAYAEEQQRSGYTGTSVNNIAVGNISGEDGVAGVVANDQGLASRFNPRTGEVVNEAVAGSKTIFRDDEGRAYVRSGFLGTERDYVPQLNMDTPTGGGSTPAQDSDSDSSSPAPRDTSNVGNYSGDRDNDGVPNWRDFNDGVGARDNNSDGSSSSEGSGKIVCTAMNASYGFGSYRQAIWLRYSEKSLTPYHEKGYHKLFLPLVDRAYNRGDKNNTILRKALENIARHRTADLRAEMQGKKRDMVGRIYRAVLEPVCYIVGRLSK